MIVDRSSTRTRGRADCSAACVPSPGPAGSTARTVGDPARLMAWPLRVTQVAMLERLAAPLALIARLDLARVTLLKARAWPQTAMQPRAAAVREPLCQ